MLLREKFDVRPISKGIKPHGSSHIVSNQIGQHIFHVGDIVDLHCHNAVIHVKILGKANEHLVGEIDHFNEKSIYFEDMKSGQKITFDEDNIFEYYD